ncbi:MAG: hypothetical protein IPL04_14960 [Chitinophagaceae bacterium]|nr:hypothetical protein [Chitinophagaceae bacterium]
MANGNLLATAARANNAAIDLIADHQTEGNSKVSVYPNPVTNITGLLFSLTNLKLVNILFRLPM